MSPINLVLPEPLSRVSLFTKLNLLVEGVYFHPVYGELDYQLPTLMKVKENFDKDVLGYPVPLFIGHEQPERRVGAMPAVGFLVPNGLSIQQGEDGRHRLFGLFQLTRQDVYESIWRGEYRYGSVELAANYKDKISGEELGPVLLAHVLTNQPFIPYMEPNRVLSEPKPLFFYQENTMSKEVKEQKMAETANETAIEVIKSAFDAYRQEAERRLAEQQQELEELRQQVKQLQKAKREAELAALVQEIQSLQLSQALKDKYIPMILADQFTERELNVVMENLRLVSQHMGSLMFSQVGSTQTEVANPYSDIIKRNEEQSKKLSI